jgi:hypothetical protein
VKRELELLVPGSAPGEKSEKLPEIAHMFNRTRGGDSGKKNQIRMCNLTSPSPFAEAPASRKWPSLRKVWLQNDFPALPDAQIARKIIFQPCRTLR